MLKKILFCITLLTFFVSGIFIGTAFNKKTELNIPSNIDLIKDTLSQNQLTKEPIEDIIKQLKPTKKASPKDRITEKDFRRNLYGLFIDKENLIIARFTDTKSMEPTLSKDANAIEIIPKKATEIQVGDIISYKSAFSDGIIIHRVVDKDIDEQGLFFRAKGDNLEYIDPEKIRFEQIKRVLVGILY